MRSAILVESELTFEIKGEHIHVSNHDGSVHFALTRHVFFTNLAKANRVSDDLRANCGVDIFQPGSREVRGEAI